VTDNIYDVIVVGGGPAGLTCGLYASRSNLKTLIIEKEGEGSLQKAHFVDNYPGFPQGVKGTDLYFLMKEHCKKFNVNFQNATVLDFEFNEDGFNEDNNGKNNIVKTSLGNFQGKFVVIASGNFQNAKKVKGEKEFIGSGVSYCATCDGAFTKNLNVILVGQGEEVGEEGLFLTQFAKNIKILVPDEKLISEDNTLAAIKSSNIEIIPNANLKEVIGSEYVEKVLVDISQKDQVVSAEYPADFVFLYLGTKNNTELYGGYFKLDDKGFIITDGSMKTNVKNVYAIGDIRAKEVRQVTTATNDGTIAALSILKEQLKNTNN